MSPKIVHYVEAFGGGVFFAISQVANEQIRLGYKVTILFSRRWDTPKNIEEHFSKNVELIEVPFSLKPKILYNHIKTLFFLINNHNPDIVHAHSSYAGFFARIFLKKKRCKIFYTPHGLSILRKDLKKITRYLLLYVEKVAHKLSGNVIACSKSEMSIFKKEISESRVYCVHNAIPTDTISKFVLVKAPKVNQFIMVGRIVPQKNPSLFIELKKYLLIKDIKGNFTWVGDGNDFWKETLLSNGISVTGMLNRRDVWKIMSKSTIFLQTSLWEGMPLTIMEAQCIGLPVVSKASIGNRDVIINKSTGMLFDKKEEVVQIVMNLLNKQNNNWSELSKSSKDFAMNNYTINKHCSDLEKIYNLK
jgi:glycosyltransferase involved in cell wall biosynthesis